MEQIKKKMANIKQERNEALDRAEEAKAAEKAAVEKADQVSFLKMYPE